MILSVRLSLLRSLLRLYDTSYRKSVWTRNTILQRSTPVLPHFFKIAPPKFWNFTYLLYLVVLITWHFVCIATNIGKYWLLWLISRWSLINALYTVRSAVSATAGLLVIMAVASWLAECHCFAGDISLVFFPRCLISDVASIVIKFCHVFGSDCNLQM